MYYVIQVTSGMESKIEEQIAVLIEKELYGRCFHPVRHVRKKFRGEWRELHEKLLPGYIFITSEHVRELYLRLQDIPTLSRILGKDGEQFVPLPEHEVEWLERLMGPEGQNAEVQISEISVSEEDVITILSGPLKDMEGCIKKIDLHRRIAKVEVDFMNRKTVIHLGIKIVGKKKA